jgi:prepilin-type N-terminal cleavage/methylation domain-containing protein
MESTHSTKESGMLDQLRKKRDEEGFTLIELLIVIVILGILATIVVFAVSGIRDKGQTSACKAEYKTLETAAEAYYAQTNVYPSDASQLVGGTYALLKSVPAHYNITSAGAITGNCP